MDHYNNRWWHTRTMQEEHKTMTEHPTEPDNAAPSAAEIADIERILRECEYHKDSTSTNAITLLPPIIKRLLAAVESLGARNTALESENARLRAALEDDDRSVEASIAYLNSTSGGTKNDVTFNRPSEGE